MNMNDNDLDIALKRFCRMHGAIIKDSELHFQKISELSSEQDYFRCHIEKETGIAIHIPKSKFQGFVNSLPGHLRESDVRHNHPALKKAYDNYMLMLMMFGENNARY